jgi:hypothetical protein
MFDEDAANEEKASDADPKNKNKTKVRTRNRAPQTVVGPPPTPKVRTRTRSPISAPPPAQKLVTGDRVVVPADEDWNTPEETLSMETLQIECLVINYVRTAFHFLCRRLDLDPSSTNPNDKEILEWMNRGTVRISKAVTTSFQDFRDDLKLPATKTSFTGKEISPTRTSMDAVRKTLLKLGVEPLPKSKTKRKKK